MSNIDLAELQSPVEYLILRTLSWGPLHGFGIARWLEDTTDAVLIVEEGTLYPALHRLERRKLIRGGWGLTENRRRAKYYTLTAAGRRALESQAQAWGSLMRVLDQVSAAAAEARAGGSA
jgi:PadR family transcriptional regulator, regulatory protein PadR